jgi:glycosyltransferase involved in cell wall biosynthesis
VSSGKRIVIASSGLGHVARGIEAWADDLAAALAARGEDVILCKGAGVATHPYERVVSCCTRESAGTRRLLRFLPRPVGWRVGLGSGYGVEQTTFAVNLIRVLRRERADILHVQDPQVAMIAQRARKLKLIHTRTILAHGTEEPAAFLRRIEFLQHLAPWHLEQVREAGAWRPTWTAIPNFIDTERFAPGRSDALRAELGIPADALVVLTAAAIKRHHKRIDHLLSEFAQLRRQSPVLPAWLVVAGGWEAQTNELVAEGERLLGDRVRFLVRFPRPRMPELFRMVDVFALCSLFEMMPIALIEAAASGLPCVVNKQPVMEWMTGAGGSWIDMARPGELAVTIRELFAERERRTKQGAAARAHCLANFSRNAVVDQIVNYYGTVVSAGHKPTGVVACA